MPTAQDHREICKGFTKGLRATLFFSPGYRSCGGDITKGFEEVVIVGPGVPQIHEIDERRPAVIVVKRNLFADQREYVHVEPLKDVPKGAAGYMAGGAYVYDCDGRIREVLGDYPVALHDRYEFSH